MHGAATLIDERSSGTLERKLSGPTNAGPIVLGKYAYMTVQGVVQCVVVFVVAWLAYAVDLTGRPVLWLMTTLVAASAAAGMALALAAICRTRQQLEASSTFLILVTSAIGGSMMPRSTMPSWMQQLGWLTPNTWVIEAYQGGLWRGQSVGELLASWLVLGGIGLVGIAIATAFAQRRVA